MSARTYAVGHRVFHNYDQGHGHGVVRQVITDYESRWPYLVRWDNGVTYWYADSDLRPETSHDQVKAVKSEVASGKGES